MSDEFTHEQALRVVYQWLQSNGERNVHARAVRKLCDDLKKIYNVLDVLAAYKDTEASAQLKRTGSYSGFDEPHAVETVRNLIQGL